MYMLLNLQFIFTFLNMLYFVVQVTIGFNLLISEENFVQVRIIVV